jgi:putative oxidoreductase
VSEALRYSSRRYAVAAGRFLLGLMFLVSGAGKIFGWSQTAGYMASKGFRLVPFFLLGAIVLEAGGALLVILGYRTRLGAAMLILFLIPTTLIFHNFWAHDGMDRQMQMVNFLKNLSILGGLLLVTVYGGGPLCLDARRRGHAGGGPAAGRS